MLRSLFAALTVSIIIFSLPAHASEKPYLQRVELNDITGWKTDDHAAALATFQKSCGDFALVNDGTATGQEQLLAPAVVWKRVCRKAMLLKPDDETGAKKFFEEEFVPMKLTSNDNEHAFVTGYFEPELNGSRTKVSPYVYPVYGPPVFPVNASRAQIEALGALNGKAPVIAYVDDPVKLFFLHVQGSGVIKAGCGDAIHVGYAGNNGRPYVAIGKIMVERGLLSRETVSMQSIEQWLNDHPEEKWNIMWENPSYIYFQEMSTGPLGTERVVLTPERSLAVDTTYIPLGMPVFVNTVVPGKNDAPFTLWRKLMIAQDTGRAIRGAQRGDIFFGSGYDAEVLAGRMKAGGDFTLFVPREIYQKISNGE